MASVDDLLRALPIRNVRADVGTKHSRTGGAMALVDLEPAAEFAAADAIREEDPSKFDALEFPDLVPMCFDNIVLGIQEELRQNFGPELPAVRVIVRAVFTSIIESNESNNRSVGRRVIQAVLRNLNAATSSPTDR